MKVWRSQFPALVRELAVLFLLLALTLRCVGSAASVPVHALLVSFTTDSPMCLRVGMLVAL